MDISSNYIRDIIKDNCDNIAFIIGNGIHYQYKDCSVSWEKLLESLWLEFIGEKRSVPNGISMTEFYDILEMNLYNHSSSNNINKLKQSVKMKDLKGLESQVLAELVAKNSQKTSKVRPVIEVLAEAIRGQHERMISLSREWCNANVDNASMLSDKDCVSQMIGALSNSTKKQILMGSIKKSVISKFPQKDEYNLRECINGIQRLNSPILTTNFDTYISDSVGATPHKLKPIGNQYKFTDFYPWNMYYSDREINNPLDGFAVWHINGTQEYSRSLRLGLSDYMGCVERARKMIQGNNLNEYFESKKHESWIGYNTWLHIIFHKSLFIFGLGLEENEVFLRWLLIQRAKYCRMYNQPLVGWYINKEIKSGKRFFLEQLGFNVIEITNYDTLYQALETL